MARGDRHPYLLHPEWHADDSDTPIAFAHRGGTDTAPENTIAAFQNAWNLGYRYLETDVRLTRDGKLVIFHDTDLLRICGTDAQIGDLTAAEVEGIRIDGDYLIPTLEELIDRFPDAHFNIDAKSEETVGPLTELIVKRNLLNQICLASFSQRRINRMRALAGPDLMTNIGSTSVAQLRLTGRTSHRGYQSLQVPVRSGWIPIVTLRVIAAARRQGIPTHVWTINDRPDMERLLNLGVDGVMTDETMILRCVLIERGKWPT